MSNEMAAGLAGFSRRLIRACSVMRRVLRPGRSGLASG
jgi:hypothetical protein